MRRALTQRTIEVLRKLLAGIRNSFRKPSPPAHALGFQGLDVIKSLVRGLRYEELSQLIGKTIIVNSLASAENDVREALQANYPFIGSLIPEEHVGAFRKYGILDLSFEVGETVPDVKPKDIRFLKSMGFIADAN